MAGRKSKILESKAGVGYSGEGSPRSGRGVDAGDFDQDGKQDLVVGNIDSKTTSLYHNVGNEMSDGVNLKTGVSQATRMMSGWGLRFFDYDNDGCNNWVGLTLRPKTTNPDAIGAVIRWNVAMLYPCL